MIITDTHCHLDLLDNPQAKYQNACEASVSTLIIPSVNAILLPKLKELSLELENVYYAAGIYPTEAEDLDKQIAEIDTLINDKPNKLVAIGECGLDFSNPILGKGHDLSIHEQSDLSLRSQQIPLFQKHIDWAIKYKLPIIIHNRKASKELLDIVARYPELTGVFHCFCQGKSFANQILEQTNFYFGLGGLITTDLGLAETVKMIPLERIVLETDSPYLIPKEAKTINTINEPMYLVYTANKLAQIKGISVEIVAEVTTDNAKRLFSLR